jgi:hypothetical protein
LFGSEETSVRLTLTPVLVSNAATVTVGPDIVLPLWVLLSEYVPGGRSNSKAPSVPVVTEYCRPGMKTWAPVKSDDILQAASSPRIDAVGGGEPAGP